MNTGDRERKIGKNRHTQNLSFKFSCFFASWSLDGVGSRFSLTSTVSDGHRELSKHHVKLFEAIQSPFQLYFRADLPRCGSVSGYNTVRPYSLAIIWAREYIVCKKQKLLFASLQSEKVNLKLWLCHAFSYARCALWSDRFCLGSPYCENHLARVHQRT